MYRIEIRPDAQREIGRLPEKAQRQVVRKINALAADPRPPGVVVLKGEWGGYCRIRSGNYRVIYAVRDEVLLILVVRVGNRRDVYE